MIRTWMQVINNHVGNLLFTEQCMACNGRSIKQHFLCEDCIIKLNPYGAEGVVTESKGGYDVMSFFPVNNLTTQIVHNIKYKGLPGLGRILIRNLESDRIKREIPNDAVIIPVPLHTIRLRERGYNQAIVLARELANITGASVYSNILFRRKYTETQTNLSSSERKENMDDVFTLSEGQEITGKKVVLVDDVYTTGATAESCIEVLKQALPAEIMVCTLLRTSVDLTENDFLLELEHFRER